MLLFTLFFIKIIVLPIVKTARHYKDVAVFVVRMVHILSRMRNGEHIRLNLRPAFLRRANFFVCKSGFFSSHISWSWMAMDNEFIYSIILVLIHFLVSYFLVSVKYFIVPIFSYSASANSS